MSNSRVIVFGTTADYVELIARRYPGRALFIVSSAEKQKISPGAVAAIDCIECPLTELDTIADSVNKHIAVHDMTISGLVGFDCETLQMASRLAQRMTLPFPTPEAIEVCQDKHRSKILWSRNGLYAPKSMRLHSLKHFITFFNQLSRPLVVKPIQGTGSNYQFMCSTKYDCIRTHHFISTIASAVKEELSSVMEDVPDMPFIAEEYVRGREFSCDFIIEKGGIRITRMARKIMLPTGPLGTTRAYFLPAQLPHLFSLEDLRGILLKAMTSLRIERAFAMADFIVNNNRLYLLEITPRPGGDCLPDLVHAACGIDTLDLAMTFAEGRHVETPPFEQWRNVIGLRLFARSDGIVSYIDCGDLTDDARIAKIRMNCRVGDDITLPPNDYSSWLLATVLFVPNNPERIRQECDDIAAKCHFTIEEPTCKTMKVS